MKSQDKPPRGRRDSRGRPPLVAKPFIAKGAAAYRIVEQPDPRKEPDDDRG
ncbi:MAG TPA: hypothetical protein VGE77_01750 [Nocardioides sp.]